MSYGVHGMTNFDGVGKNTQTTITFKSYDLKSRKLSNVTKSFRDNLWAIYLSAYRLLSNTVLPDYNLSIFKKVSRRVQVLYIDELIPHYYADNEMWTTHYKKIFSFIRHQISNFGRDIRRSGVPLVVLIRPNKLLTQSDIDVLKHLWGIMGFPTTDNSSTRFRFYLPTSSLEGKTLKEKAATLRSMRSASRMFTLLPNDLSLNNAIQLADKFGYRVTFDSKVHRNEKGKRIAPGSDEWESFSRLSKDGAGNSPMYPIIFTSDKLDAEYEQMVRFYSKYSDVVFLKV